MDKKHIHEMLEILTETALSELHKGTECVCTEEMGKVVDMIKDLADAEKNVWEKCYWKDLAEAIEEEEELQCLLFKEGRAGYDRWRTSHGRFAPKGTGHETSMWMATGRAGYDPRMPNPYWPDPRWIDGEPWMASAGYDRDGAGSREWRSSDGHGEHTDTRHPSVGHMAGRMGYTPDDYPRKETHLDHYNEARKHYHESGSASHKQEMSSHAKEYLGEAIGSMRDIFAEADPELQQKMKSDLANLYREFGGK